MRIALLSTMINPLAEPYAGGTEAITARLAAGLAARGHRVTLLATEGSAVSGVDLVTLGTPARALSWPAPPEEMDGATMRRLLVEEQRVFHRAFLYLHAHRAAFDVVHNHSFSGLPIVLGGALDLPMLTTLHCPPILLEQIAAFEALPARASHSVIAVSHALAALYRDIVQGVAVIHNGVDLPEMPVQAAGDAGARDRVLFVGRMAPEKGPDLAVAAALAARKRLALIGRIEDRRFFDRAIAPHVDGERIAYLGSMPQEQVWRHMAAAAAVLFTPRWAEPCSLAVLEAMACGTPAIAFRAGGLPEEIVDGVTGYLVADGDVEAIARALGRLPAIARDACREHVRRNFATAVMIDAYERRYAAMPGAGPRREATRADTR